jgi:hypothetical protein
MNFDDDVPPDLVETNVETGDEEKVVKVPITIVTGMTPPDRSTKTSTNGHGQDIWELGKQPC